MDRDSKKLSLLAAFTFCLSPILAWISVRFSSETAVFASLSRMIWYSGSAAGIFIAIAIHPITTSSSRFMGISSSVRYIIFKYICWANGVKPPLLTWDSLNYWVKSGIIISG